MPRSISVLNVLLHNVTDHSVAAKMIKPNANSVTVLWSWLDIYRL